MITDETGKEIESGKINQSTSRDNKVVHFYTYLVAMRDFCDKTLLQMQAAGEVDKKFLKALEAQLEEAKTVLGTSEFNRLKIERDLYNKFLKQMKHEFPHLPSLC